MAVELHPPSDGQEESLDAIRDKDFGDAKPAAISAVVDERLCNPRPVAACLYSDSDPLGRRSYKTRTESSIEQSAFASASWGAELLKRNLGNSSETRDRARGLANGVEFRLRPRAAFCSGTCCGTGAFLRMSSCSKLLPRSIAFGASGFGGLTLVALGAALKAIRAAESSCEKDPMLGGGIREEVLLLVRLPRGLLAGGRKMPPRGACARGW